MPMYIIHRTDQNGGYVTKPGSSSSYVVNPFNAQIFMTWKEAMEASCPENEVVIPLPTIAVNPSCQ